MSNESSHSPFTNISPSCIIEMLLRNLWMIIAAALICAMGVSLYASYFVKPQYNATLTYAVTSRKTSYTSGNNLSSAKEVAAIITELLESDVITESIRGYSKELADFNGKISASNVTESNFINVTSTASSPESAFLALDALVKLFPELSDYISDKSVVQLIRNPSVSGAPINPFNTRGYSLLAALIGAALTVLLLIRISVKRETVQTRAGARNMLDAPIIASICREQKNRTLKSIIARKNDKVQVFSPSTSFSYTEQINTIGVQIEHEFTENSHKLFLITGVGENEGKSTVAANIAAALALKGRNVALIDGDLRNPSINRFFDGKYKTSLPLNRMLAAEFSEENLHKCMVKNKALGLSMLYSVKSDIRSTELLTGPTMKAMLSHLRSFDCVIIDSPPMGFFPDAEALSELVDASILIVRQDYTPAPDINDAIDTLRRAGSKFLGCVLNQMTGASGNGYGYGHKYGYGHRYGYGYGHKSGHKHSEDKKIRGENS